MTIMQMQVFYGADERIRSVMHVGLLGNIGKFSCSVVSVTREKRWSAWRPLCIRVQFFVRVHLSVRFAVWSLIWVANDVL